MELSNAILRVFDVRAIPGKSEELKQKLSATSVTVVEGKPGNIGYFFGESLSSEKEDLVFISVWRDMDSIKSLFGEDWENSYLPEGYEDLIDTCSITHIQFSGKLAL